MLIAKDELTEMTNKMEKLTTAVKDFGETKSLLETAELKFTEVEAQLVAVQEEKNSRISHLSKTCDMMQHEKQQLMQEGELEEAIQMQTHFYLHPLGRKTRRLIQWYHLGS